MSFRLCLAVGLTCLAAGIAPTRSTAQESSAEFTLRVGGGIQSTTFGGIGASDLYGSSASKGSRSGFNIGVSLGMSFGRGASIVPGILYVQKGSKYTTSSDELQLNLDYVEIPLLGMLRLTPEDSPVGFHLFGGPDIAFQINCDVETTTGGTTESVSCADDEDIQQLDFGGTIGAGVSVPFSERFSVMLSGGLDLGLRSLDTGANDFKNLVFFSNLSVAIPLD